MSIHDLIGKYKCERDSLIYIKENRKLTNIELKQLRLIDRFIFDLENLDKEFCIC